MSSPIDQIKERIGIADLIGSYIKLQKSGANFKANCPFHNEKTPSFFISSSRNTYYCFGCGAKGDIFTFVEEFEGLDFRGALRILAERAGVSLKEEYSHDKKDKDLIYKALESATIYFQKNLEENSKALEYLEKRGLTRKTIKEWRLGFARDEWRSLYSFLLSKGFSVQVMEKAGLIKKSEKENSSGPGYYDRFRSRIMFPLSDSAGRIIAFSGRIFAKDSENEAKYLNSPETDVFSKSKILYGFDKAKQEIRVKDFSILVEGQMDLVISHQAGYRNTVATSGTAFTEDHAVLLKRISNKIMLCFDSDKAGMMASERSAKVAISNGMEVKIAVLPDGLDPADLIISDDKKWIESLKNSKHVIEHVLDQIILKEKDQRKLGIEIKNKVLPYIASLGSEIEKAHFISLLSRKTGLKENVVLEDLKKVSPDDLIKNIENVRSAPVVTNGREARGDFIEKRIVGIIKWQGGLKEEESLIDVSKAKERLADILKEDVKKYLDNKYNNSEDLVFMAEVSYSKERDLNKVLDELFINFEEDKVKEDFSKTMYELSKAEMEKDHEKVSMYLKKCQDLGRRLSELIKSKGG